MKTKTFPKFAFFLLIAFVVAGIGAWYLLTPRTPAQETQKIAPVADFKNATYNIDGINITLNDGYAETQIDQMSRSKTITQYFGNEAKGDLNGDGIQDVAFLLTQSNKGGGIFYYAAAALKTQTGFLGTNAVFLGTRIAPQTTEIKNTELIVNYANRKPTEPLNTKPSIGVTKYLMIENGNLVFK